MIHTAVPIPLLDVLAQQPTPTPAALPPLIEATPEAGLLLIAVGSLLVAAAFLRRRRRQASKRQ
jgi:hypothetical protein